MRGPLLQLTIWLLIASPVVYADEAANELARQATDPTASLMAFNFLADYTGGYNGPNNGQDDDSLDLTLRPVIPFTAFGRKNILRLTVPFRVSGRGNEGLGSVSIFDLAVFDQSWGRFGIGAVATLSQKDAAADTFAVGPAVGGVWQYSSKLNLGAFSQSVFAGDTALSSLQPIVAYQLGNGWSVSAGDLQWTYDFKQSRWLSFPIGFQLGKVSSIGNQAVRYAVNPQYNLVDLDGSESWSIAFTFALLVPGS